MILDTFNSVVMQPVTVCNLDCTYCYLPNRHLNLRMFPWVAENVAQVIENQNSDYPVTIIWHSGEPMATGLGHFHKLLAPFENLRKLGKVIHNIQTNATIINSKWCDFFQEYEFRVGVSIDGPDWANLQRLDLAGKPTFPKVMRGIRWLNERNIPFGVIAVIHKANIERPEEIYEFFCDLGCYSLAINIEEIEGINTSNGQIDDQNVTIFWKRLFIAWQKNPILRVREFNRSLSYIEAVLEEKILDKGFQLDLFPTVTWNGDVYMLSPEFAGIKSEAYNDFVVGNLVNNNLTDIIKSARNAQYVVDFVKGVDACKEECPYYNYCGGGYASNKYFEHGSTNATETMNCRNIIKRLLDAILDV